MIYVDKYIEMYYNNKCKEVIFMMFYSVDKVANIMDVHKETVYRWIRKGKLKASKPGKHYRIKKEDFDEFIDENMNKKTV